MAVLQAAQHGTEEIDVRSGEKGRLWLITRKNILVVRRHWRFYCGTVNEAEALQQVCDVLVLVQLDGTGLPVALNCHAEDPPGSSKVLDGEACSQVLLQLPDEVLVVVGQHDVVDVQSYNDVSGSGPVGVDAWISLRLDETLGQEPPVEELVEVSGRLLEAVDALA